MTIQLEIILAIFALSAGLWLIYWMPFRPVLQERLRIQIRQLKTELDWARINGKDGAGSAAAQTLADEARKLPLALESSFLLTVVFGPASAADSAWLQEREGQLEAAPRWLREIDRRKTGLATKAMLLNSPAWWPVICWVLLLAQMSRKVEDWWRHRTSGGIAAAAWPASRRWAAHEA